MQLLSAVLLPAAVFYLSGCLEADTRGDEPVDEVVITGTPMWDNGIDELMQLKCGTCHQVPAGPFSPANVPNNLDLNFQSAPSPGVRGARDILAFINDGILRSPTGGARRMPLEYATPLTDQELGALETWSLGGGL